MKNDHHHHHHNLIRKKVSQLLFCNAGCGHMIMAATLQCYFTLAICGKMETSSVLQPCYIDANNPFINHTYTSLFRSLLVFNYLCKSPQQKFFFIILLDSVSILGNIPNNFLLWLLFLLSQETFFDADQMPPSVSSDKPTLLNFLIKISWIPQSQHCVTWSFLCRDFWAE
jgi:hypothetical protein